jgi:hypothetical protein
MLGIRGYCISKTKGSRMYTDMNVFICLLWRKTNLIFLHFIEKKSFGVLIVLLA